MCACITRCGKRKLFFCNYSAESVYLKRKYLNVHIYVRMYVYILFLPLVFCIFDVVLVVLSSVVSRAISVCKILLDHHRWWSSSSFAAKCDKKTFGTTDSSSIRSDESYKNNIIFIIFFCVYRYVCVEQNGGCAYYYRYIPKKNKKNIWVHRRVIGMIGGGSRKKKQSHTKINRREAPKYYIIIPNFMLYITHTLTHTFIFEFYKHTFFFIWLFANKLD